LGKRLAGLSKDERKAAKAADADRQTRRLAKKKARHELLRQGVEESKGLGKQRARSGGKPGATGPISKPRARSDKSILRKNVKK